MFLHPPTPTPTPTPYLLQLNPALMRHEAQLWGLDGDLTGWRPDRAFGGWYHIQAVPGFCGVEHEQNMYC